MSNRSAVEFNHDYVSEIMDSPDEFVQAIAEHLHSPGKFTTEQLSRFGVKVFGMRHHSDPFRVDWAGQITEQE